MKHKRRLAAAVFAVGMLWQTVGALPAETLAVTVQEESESSWDEDFDWELDEDTGKLTIYGNGNMPEDGWGNRPWFNQRKQIQTVELQYGITKISDYAFEGCENLTEVQIPDSVITIGEDVFSECSSLTTISIPESITSIGSSAFYRCSSLTDIEFPEGITILSSHVLRETPITSFVIPDSVKEIGDGAFFCCTKRHTS